MDAYLVALNLITVMSSVFLKAQNNSFIPFINDYIDSKKRQPAVASVAKSTLLLFFGVGLTICLGAGWIVSIIAPGLEQFEHELATRVLTILSPFLVFSSFMGLTKGILDNQMRFWLSGTIQLTRITTAIFILLLLVGNLQIFAVPIAHILSYSAAFVVCIFLFKAQGYSLELRGKWAFNDIGRFSKLMAPLVLGSLMWETVHIADTFVASFLKQGSISYLGYSTRLMRFIFLFASAITTVMFPMLSKKNRPEDDKEFLRILTKSFQGTAFVLLPITALIVLFANSIASLLFQRGAFTAADVTTVSDTIRCYSYVFFGGPLGSLLTYAYYSRKANSQSVKYATVSAILNVVLNFVFSHFWEHYGIALASSVSILFGNILFMKNLKTIVPDFRLRRFLSSIVPIFLSAGVSFLAVFFIQNLLGFDVFDEGSVFSEIVTLGIGSAVLLGTYFSALAVFRVELLVSAFSRRRFQQEKASHREIHPNDDEKN